MAEWSTTLKLDFIDPYTEDDFLFEWGPYLDGANITAQEVTAVNGTIASSNIVNSAQDVTCRVTSGVVDVDLELTCKITTDDATPRKEKRTVTIPVRSL